MRPWSSGRIPGSVSATSRTICARARSVQVANVNRRGRGDFTQGLVCVSDEVDHHLVQLVGIDRAHGKIGSKLQHHRDGVHLQRIGQQFHRLLHHAVEVHPLPLWRAAVLLVVHQDMEHGLTLVG
jgi:hypothetical protein